MKSRWVSHVPKLNARDPYWELSLSSLSKISTCSTAFAETSSPVLNHVDRSSLLSICGWEGDLHLGSSLHASIVKENSGALDSQKALVVWNSLLSMYLKCGQISDAVKVFDYMTVKDTVSWNTLISGFFKNRDIDMGFALFRQLHESGVFKLDKATLTTILSACDTQEFCNFIKMVHGLAFSSGFEQETTVGNALITSYFKCGCFSLGRQVFDGMIERNVVTWTAVISGLAQNDFFEETLKLFVQMRRGSVIPNALTYLSSLMACSGLQALREGRQIHGLVWKLGTQSDLCIESALMDLYSKCGRVEDAWKIFESAQELDEVSLTIILGGFAQNGLENEAMHIFVKMVNSGFKIDPETVSAVLGVFGVDTSLFLGQQIHSLAIKMNFLNNPFVCNGLVNMYSKCGDLIESARVFWQMPHRNIISWNSIIAAYARHGNGPRALKLYDEMRGEGVEPTDVTFLSLLHACSHAGLVEKGMQLFKSMARDHNITPRMEHYACVVDMLGRAKLLEEAKIFIEGLPEKPSALIWQALLGACGIHGNSEIGKYAADQLYLLAPDSAVPYILMANIYSNEGRWKDRAHTMKKMKEMGIEKETGISWIEIEEEMNSFVVWDRMHPQADSIYSVMSGLFKLMKDEGYVPDKKYILYHMDHNENGTAISA